MSQTDELKNKLRPFIVDCDYANTNRCPTLGLKVCVSCSRKLAGILKVCKDADLRFGRDYGGDCREEIEL